MRFIALISSFLFFTAVHGQSYWRTHTGASLGIVFNVGTHVNSIGLNAKAFYTDYFFQANIGTTFYLHERSYGQRAHFWESRNYFGLMLLAGKKERTIDFQLDGLNHQTQFNYAVGFNYLIYKDNAGTSQLSGGFGLHIKNFSLYHENDVFGGQANDRFRTGHLYASYQYNEFKFGTGINIWTGETRDSRWEKIHLDKCPNGFRILEDLPYGKTSHGIFYGTIAYQLPYTQTTSLRIGIDSEQIRHGFQNRFAHDLIFLPKRMKRTTPHYPRLDEHGCPVFYRENVRKNQLFLEWSANENWSN